jgi:phage baseplate assembly protein W
MASLARQDFAFPFQIDLASQQVAQAGYAAHVDQMIRQLLLTAPGERVNLPQFGCGLRALVFAPNSASLEATVRLRVTQGLNQWLAGEVAVAGVSVTGGTAADPETLQVTVSYTLVETQTSQSVTVTVT